MLMHRRAHPLHWSPRSTEPHPYRGPPSWSVSGAAPSGAPRGQEQELRRRAWLAEVETGFCDGAIG
eukprot:scaffold32923_cov75-Phaeocystis_antarctica.AAC.2